MKENVKKIYNSEDKVIITEYRPDRIRYVSTRLVKKDGKYDITKQLPMDRKTKNYLKKNGFEVRKEYDSIAEIQKMLDQLDGWHFAKEYIPEIEAIDDMFVEGIYEYIGENSDVFTKGKEYFCSVNSDECFIVIGNDLHDYNVDEDEFKLVKQYYYVSPFVSVSIESELDQLIMEWKEKKNLYHDEYYQDGIGGHYGWPAKLTGIDFDYEGEHHELHMEDIGIKYNDPWDEGFFEFLQQYIEEDLKSIGAENIASHGFLD